MSYHITYFPKTHRKFTVKRRRSGPQDYENRPVLQAAIVKDTARDRTVSFQDI